MTHLELVNCCEGHAIHQQMLQLTFSRSDVIVEEIEGLCVGITYSGSEKSEVDPGRRRRLCWASNQ